MRTRPPLSPLARRLCDLAWAVHTGDAGGLGDLRHLIEAGGGTWEETWSAPLTAADVRRAAGKRAAELVSPDMPDDTVLIPARLVEVSCTGPSGIRSGFAPGGLDPIAAYVTVSFLLIGPLWPKDPDAAAGFRAIGRRWKARSTDASISGELAVTGA